MSDEDDLFATLGGSLMKDLLADLAVDDGETGWMSLEDLEKELSQLGKAPETTLSGHAAAPVPPTSAATMVLNHQQTSSAAGAGNSGNLTTTTAGINNPSVDAWSLSFQKFSAAALEQDFLQADTARKQQQVVAPAVPPPPGVAPPGLDLSKVQDYDINEGPTLTGPPPGMPAQGQGASVLDQAAAQSLQKAQASSGQAPQQSESSVSKQQPDIPKPMPATPQNSVSMPPQGPPQGMPGMPPLPHGMPPPHMMGMIPPPHGMPPHGSPPMMGMVPPHHQGMPPPGSPPMMGMVPPPHQGMPPPGSPPMMGMVPPNIGPPRIPVAVPVRGGPAWQQPQPAPQQQPRAPVPPPGSLPPRYCNPHPRAPPIPAATLASKYMNSRDIAYVVHGILRHVNSAGASAIDDYDVQYWVRRNGKVAEQAVVNRPDKNDANASKAKKSREVKAKEWSSEHATLGHVAKTNVARPRALIAHPLLKQNASEGDESASTKKQRATLWKARIYVDQAYQAFHQVMELWRSAPPGQVPPSMQIHLLKLFKCMGIQKSSDDYTVQDNDALALLLKLDKGKVLLSRVLEQALLPPKAVQVTLPVILRVLLQQTANTSAPSTDIEEDPVDARLFVILSRVVESLPQLDSQIILQSVQVVVDVNNNASPAQQQAFFSSTARMQCTHALLQRGGRAAAEDANFQTKWNTMEETFMAILAGM